MSKKAKSIISATDSVIVSKIGDYLRGQRLDISDILVEQVLLEYFSIKGSLLKSGEKISEKGLGSCYAGTRLLSSRLGDITAYVRYELDSDFKSELIERLEEIDHKL